MSETPKTRGVTPSPESLFDTARDAAEKVAKEAGIAIDLSPDTEVPGTPAKKMRVPVLDEAGTMDDIEIEIPGDIAGNDAGIFKDPINYGKGLLKVFTDRVDQITSASPADKAKILKEAGIPESIAGLLDKLNPEQLKQLNQLPDLLKSFPKMSEDALKTIISNPEAIAAVTGFFKKFGLDDPSKAAEILKDKANLGKISEELQKLVTSAGNSAEVALKLLSNSVLPATIKPYVEKMLKLVPPEQYKKAVLLAMPYMPAPLVKESVLKMVTAMPASEVVAMVKASGQTSTTDNLLMMVMSDQSIKGKAVDKLASTDPEIIKKAAIAALERKTPEEIQAMSVPIAGGIAEGYYQKVRTPLMPQIPEGKDKL